MIMNIAAANSARTPLLVLASNMNIAGDDRETFIQTGYQQPLTTGLKKYGKRLIAPDRVWEYGAYAFRNLKTGIPGPAHLDFPGEVARARFTDAAKLALTTIRRIVTAPNPALSPPARKWSRRWT